MNGQPRINAGFLIGHHEFYEDERRRGMPAVKKRRMVTPRRVVKGKRKTSGRAS